MTRIILHVVESFGAGVASAIANYVDATPEAVHHILRASRREHVPERELARFASVRNLPRNFAAYAALQSAIRELQPDLIHAHSSWAGALTRTGLNNIRIPILYTPHCFASERLDLPTPVRKLFTVAEKVMAKRTSALLACSPREAQLAKSIGIQKVLFVPNVAIEGAIQTTTLSPGVIMVGRLAAQKDPHFFQRVSEIVRRTHPETQFTWIGDGDKAHRSNLTKAGVNITGWLDPEEAKQLVAAATVYVHTAAWEGMPISVLEAHALQIPVVVRDIAALEAVPAEAKAASPEALAKLVIHLLSCSPAERLIMAAHIGEAFAENTFATQRTRLVEAYGLEPTNSPTVSQPLIEIGRHLN